MKRLSIKEAQAHYNISLDEVVSSDEVVIFEKDGQPVAALLPIEEYNAFQNWREDEQRRLVRQAEEAAIEREHAAFQKMLPELLQEYEGRAVALYQGQVVGVGNDRMKVWRQAREELGHVPVYVQTVEYPPRVYELSSVEVVTDVDL